MHASVVTAVVETLESRQLLSAAYPTAPEQYMIELVNRARLNPVAEAARFGISLNEGLADGTISTAPKQPLAINPYLTDSARSHAEYLRTSGTFSHTGAGGSDPGQRMAASGYSSSGWAENIALSLSSGSLAPANKMDSQHQNLFVDSTISGRGHRTNMMTEWVREIGVGAASGPMNYNGSAWGGSVVTTEDFANSTGNAFLTGVAYTDAVSGDQFYTVGEGMAGVTITATPVGGGASASTVTWDAGGYSLRLAPGTYNVAATGGGLSAPVYYNAVAIGSTNVKRDVRNGQSSDSAPTTGGGSTTAPGPTPTPDFAVVDTHRALVVTGTALGDVITLAAGRAGRIVATLAGVSMTFSTSAIDIVYIYAGAGNDTVTLSGAVAPAYVDGGDGKDHLIGSVGSDTLTGGAGPDVLNGGDGNDRLNGSGGNDSLLGGNGDDRLYGLTGNDWIEGHGGVDRVWGGDGNDTVTGGNGFDKLFGEDGDDQLYGNTGNDYLVGAAGADYLNGGDSSDTADSDSADTRIAVEILL